jgi:hypothetical protein
MATFSDVRLAQPADEEPLMALLAEMHAETGIGRLDPARVRIAIRAGIGRQGGVVGVVRGPEGVEASIGLFIGSSWYSPDAHLFDLWSFVGEPHRRSPHAKSMILFAKQAAVDLGLPLVMTVVSNESTARKERLFERQMPRSGSIYTFNNGTPVAA